MQHAYAKSALSAKELVAILEKEESFQLVDPFFIASERQLELAAYCSGNNPWIAKSQKNEFLLWLSGKHEVRKAIGKAGIKSNVFVLVVFGEKGKIGSILKKLKARRLAESEIGKIKSARFFGKPKNGSICGSATNRTAFKNAKCKNELELLERMATARIR